MPGDRSRLAAGQHREPVVEAPGQLVQRQRAELDRGELDGERDAVEAPAQPDDVARVLRGEQEVRHGGGGAQREQLDRVSAEEHGAIGVGYRQRLDLEGVLALSVERLPARRQEPHAGRLAHDGLDQRGAGVEHVLAGVQDQQQPTVAQVIEHRVQLGPRVLLGQPEHAADGVDQQLGIAQAGQLDDPHAVGIGIDGLGADDERDPRFADTAGTDHRHQAGPLEQGGDLREFVLPADEVRKPVLLGAS